MLPVLFFCSQNWESWSAKDALRYWTSPDKPSCICLPPQSYFSKEGTVYKSVWIYKKINIIYYLILCNYKNRGKASNW